MTRDGRSRTSRLWEPQQQGGRGSGAVASPEQREEQDEQTVTCLCLGGAQGDGRGDLWKPLSSPPAHEPS